MGSADCRSLAVGLENCRFEGPVRIHVPISQRLGKVDPDGSFAISLPLPSTTQTVRLLLSCAQWLLLATCVFLQAQPGFAEHTTQSALSPHCRGGMWLWNHLCCTLA